MQLPREPHLDVLKLRWEMPQELRRSFPWSVAGCPAASLAISQELRRGSLRSFAAASHEASPLISQQQQPQAQ